MGEVFPGTGREYNNSCDSENCQSAWWWILCAGFGWYRRLVFNHVATQHAIPAQCHRCARMDYLVLPVGPIFQNQKSGVFLLPGHLRWPGLPQQIQYCFCGTGAPTGASGDKKQGDFFVQAPLWRYVDCPSDHQSQLALAIQGRMAGDPSHAGPFCNAAGQQQCR